MNANVTSIVRGAALGVAVGAVAVAMSKAKGTKAKSIRKKAGKAMKSLGNVIDDVAYMIR